MKEDPGEGLLQVAEAVARGSPIDWLAETRSRPDLKHSLELLRQVDTLARAHQESTASGAFGSDPELPHFASWGHLIVLEQIGEGTFGEIYRAHDPTLQREVALKLWRRTEGQAGDQQFLEEARRLGRIRHPNVLVVHGADRHQGRAGMWTDLLKGSTLEELLVRQGPFGAHEAALIGMDLCRALAAVHGAGLVHRDVKTSNAMREHGGRIVLMDFGCGGDLPPKDRPHETTSIRGTPVAMAPEQIGGLVVGPPTDLYGLGVLLYRLVTGRYPVEADTLDELAYKHAAREVVMLRDRRPDLPGEFVRVIEKAMDHDPRRRFQSAGEMERALAEAAGVGMAPVPAATLPAPPFAKAPSPPHNRTWFRWPRVVVPVAAGVLLVLAAAWILEWVRSSSETETARIGGAERTPAVPPSVTTPAAFGVWANLYRERDGAAERLTPGGKIGPGDQLFLEVEGSEDFHVYVLNEDLQGRIFVLFPAPIFDGSNPLQGDQVHRLPGARQGKNVNWKVTSAGGEEAIIVVASTRPLETLERDIARLPRAALGAPVAYGEVSASSIEELYRGIGGVASSRAAAPAQGPRRLSEIVGKLPTEASARDPWIWQIQLQNPAR